MDNVQIVYTLQEELPTVNAEKRLIVEVVETGEKYFGNNTDIKEQIVTSDQPCYVHHFMFL